MTAPFDPIAFTRDLVRLPSCDPPGGELAVAQKVHRTLTALGLPATLDVFDGDRANVLARVRGGTAPALVFSAHMDTTPTGQAPWSFDPFCGDLVDGRIRGRGASDMKGALAAFVAAAARLKDGPPLAGDVILAFTAGESANCLGARRLVAQGFQAEIGAFLCGEPSDLQIIAAEPAILWLEARAHGRIGHVSGDPGVNAIDLMMDALPRLKALKIDAPAHPLLAAPRIAVGRIEGGSAVNVTPDRCTAQLDIRHPPGPTPEEIRALAQAAAPGGVEITILDAKPAVSEPVDSPFLKVCAAAARAETGAPPAISGVSYYSDGAILLEGIEAPFCILGPGTLGMSGQADETAPAEAIRRAARIYARIATEWLGVARG